MVLYSGRRGRWLFLLVFLLVAAPSVPVRARVISAPRPPFHPAIVNSAASLIIQTGWYRTPYPWLGGITAAILLSWGMVTLRTRSLVHHRRELERLVAERTAQLQKEKQAL